MLQNPSILVVDDEEPLREVIQDVLRRRIQVINGSLHEAPSATAAWELIQTTQFNLVITDRDMPGMTGVELTRRIRTDVGNAIKIIGISARSTSRDEFMAAGANGFLDKPFDVNDLQNTVLTTLEIH